MAGHQSSKPWSARPFEYADKTNSANHPLSLNKCPKWAIRYTRKSPSISTTNPAKEALSFGSSQGQWK